MNARSYPGSNINQTIRISGVGFGTWWWWFPFSYLQLTNTNNRLLVLLLFRVHGLKAWSEIFFYFLYQLGLKSDISLLIYERRVLIKNSWIPPAYISALVRCIKLGHWLSVKSKIKFPDRSKNVALLEGFYRHWRLLDMTNNIPMWNSDARCKIRVQLKHYEYFCSDPKATFFIFLAKTLNSKFLPSTFQNAIFETCQYVENWHKNLFSLHSVAEFFV